MDSNIAIAQQRKARLLAALHGEVLPTFVKYHSPVIVFLNGCGRSGKDFFANVGIHTVRAAKISSITPVVNAVDFLINEESHLGFLLAKDSRDAKDNLYRTFLHEVKAAWEKFSGGPENVLFGQVMKLCEQDLDIIYLFVRECEQISNLCDIFANQGIPSLTVLISGLHDPAEYENESDRDVENMDYDIVISNIEGCQEEFYTIAENFAETIAAVNRYYMC